MTTWSYRVVNLITYLESKGVVSVGNLSSDGNQCMSPCPHCEEISTPTNQRFFVNSEVGHCFKCGERGNVYVYQKVYGDFISPTDRGASKKSKASWVQVGEDLELIDEIPEMFIPEDLIDKSVAFFWSSTAIARKAQQYLMDKRGFSESVLRYWRIGLIVKKWCDKCETYRIPSNKRCPKCNSEVEGDAHYYLAIPFFDKEGTLVSLKFRTFFGDKEFMKEKGGLTALYGLDKLDLAGGVVFITEAELDAIALYQLGIENVVSIAGSENWRDTWRKEFINFDTIYLVMDPDKAGLKAVRKLAEDLGSFRCRHIHLPVGIKDPAKFLEEGGSNEEFQEIIKKATTLSAKMWLKAGDLQDEVEAFLDKANTEGDGYSTAWEHFNELIGSIRMGEFTVVTADTGAGKSMWTTDLILALAQQNIPVGVASFELTKLMVLLRSISQHSGIAYKELKEHPELVRGSIQSLDTRPYYILKLHGEVPLEELEQILQWGYIHYKVKVIVLDHLHYFVPGMHSGNERFMLNTAVKMINRWCEDWNIHIILVVHPSKMGGDSNSRYGRRVDMDMLRGAAAIKQEAHNVWSLYRAQGYEYVQNAKGEYNQGAMELWNQKCRSPDGRLGFQWFKYNMETLKYTSVSKREGQALQFIDNRGIQKMRELNKPQKGVDVDLPVELEQNEEPDISTEL